MSIIQKYKAWRAKCDERAETFSVNVIGGILFMLLMLALFERGKEKEVNMLIDIFRGIK